MTFTKRFIACSVCTVDLAFMLNVMQCKEILYIICKIAIIVNQNIIEDVRRIKMKTKIRSPSLCKDCLDYSWHVDKARAVASSKMQRLKFVISQILLCR